MSWINLVLGYTRDHKIKLVNGLFMRKMSINGFLCSRYLCCWWPGDTRSLGVISHGILYDTMAADGLVTHWSRASAEWTPLMSNKNINSMSFCKGIFTIVAIWCITGITTSPHLKYRTGTVFWVMGSANERRRYSVTSSLIGWSHTQKYPLLFLHYDWKVTF